MRITPNVLQTLFPKKRKIVLDKESSRIRNDEAILFLAQAFQFRK